MDSHKRSIAKAFTWRATATAITMGIVLLVTGELELAATAGCFDVVLKLIAYYTHERVWLKLGGDTCESEEDTG